MVDPLVSRHRFEDLSVVILRVLLDHWSIHGCVLNVVVVVLLVVDLLLARTTIAPLALIPLMLLNLNWRLLVFRVVYTLPITVILLLFLLIRNSPISMRIVNGYCSWRGLDVCCELVLWCRDKMLSFSKVAIR